MGMMGLGKGEFPLYQTRLSDRIIGTSITVQWCPKYTANPFDISIIP